MSSQETTFDDDEDFSYEAKSGQVEQQADAEEVLDLYEGFEDLSKFPNFGQPESRGIPEPQHVSTSQVQQSSKERAKIATTAPARTDEATKASVYIANLQWWTTDAQVEGLCGEYGEVVEATFFEDPQTGKSKGCVQVQMATPQQAVACRQGLNGRVIDGKKCIVTAAKPASPEKPRYSKPQYARRAVPFRVPQRMPHRPAMPPMDGMNPRMGMAGQINLPPMPPGMGGIPMPPGMNLPPMPGMPLPPQAMMDATNNANRYHKRYRPS